MEFINHAINWCKGEIFEARMFLLIGLLVTIVALLFWKLGSTPSARAMFIPLLIIGLLVMVFSITMQISNQKRITTFTESWQKDKAAFIKSEKERTEQFMKWYPFTMYTFSAIIVIGILCYLFWAGAWGRSIGLTLILFGFSILILDHFSEERAKGYYEEIVKEMNKTS